MTNRWILVSFILLAACSGNSADKTPDPVALVQMAPARQGTVSDSVALYGAVEPAGGSERILSAPGEAIVAAIVAPPGSAVRPGSLVVQLRPSPQSALDTVKASADAAAADAAFARTRRLKADGLMGDADVETARAAAAAADATLASLRGRAGGLAMVAPVAGVVDAVLVKPGDLVAAGAPVARIAAGGAVRARFGIDPALAGAIGAGGRIAVTAGSGTITVPVSGVDRVVDPTTRLAAVFATIPAGANLALGQPLKGTLQRASGKHGIVIPYVAVQDDGGEPYVFVVKGGVAHRQKITLGTQAGDSVIVDAGVAAGDQVVTLGGTALDDGMKVRTGPIAAGNADDKGAK